MEYIIEVEGIHYRYPDGTNALNGVTMSIQKGKKVAILGSNGAGKSTLFLHLNGILRPHRGKIRFAEKDISYKHSSLMELRKNVGIVFQDPDTQLFSASVLQEISFGPMNLGLPRTEVMKRVESAMAATGIQDLKQKPTHFLSYGQKKRVSIADILAMEPELIIFDEPTAFLDPKVSRQVVEIFDSLHKQGKTVILSTHEVDVAYSWADYIFVMNRGAIVGEGKPVRVFSDERLLKQADLAKPWILEVYEDLVRKGWLPPTGPVPKTREDLLNCIPARTLGESDSRLILAQG